MEYQVLTPQDGQYPRKLRERLGADAPTLYYHGPLKLLDRFTMGVVCTDLHAGESMLETNDMLFTMREYALNYIGGWHSVMETEIFRVGLYRPNDPKGLRSVTMFTARGLARENWDDFLGDRFGYSGPFTGFPEKEEYYRRAAAGELLVLSITEPDMKRLLRANIMTRNWIVCALADVVFVPFAEKGRKTYVTCKRVVEAGIPVFTCGQRLGKDVCPDLYALGIPGLNRKTVGPFLDQLGALRDGEPPFPPREPFVGNTGPIAVGPPRKAVPVQNHLWSKR